MRSECQPAAQVGHDGEEAAGIGSEHGGDSVARDIAASSGISAFGRSAPRGRVAGRRGTPPRARVIASGVLGMSGLATLVDRGIAGSNDED